MTELETAGEALIRAAEHEFPPSSIRCVWCGFRKMDPIHHHPATHPYRAPDEPFVAALREFVKAVSRLEEPKS